MVFYERLAKKNGHENLSPVRQMEELRSQTALSLCASKKLALFAYESQHRFGIFNSIWQLFFLTEVYTDLRQVGTSHSIIPHPV